MRLRVLVPSLLAISVLLMLAFAQRKSHVVVDIAAVAIGFSAAYWVLRSEGPTSRPNRIRDAIEDEAPELMARGGLHARRSTIWRLKRPAEIAFSVLCIVVVVLWYFGHLPQWLDRTWMVCTALWVLHVNVEDRQRLRQKEGERRWRSGLCVKCGYNMTGNESGICPECGTPTTAGAKA